MHPELHLGGLEVGAYRTFTVLALAAGFAVAMTLTARRGTPWRAALGVVGLAMAGGVVGARLFEAATAAHPFLDDPSRLFALRAGDMAIYGGLIGAVAAGVAAVRWWRLSVPRLADHLAPAIGVGIAVLRVGCYLTGCCFGTETDLAIGVTYPAGSQPALFQIDGGSGLSLFRPVHPVHPMPLYEIAGALLAAAAGYLALRRGARHGTAMALVVVIYSVTRLAVHPVRATVPGGLPNGVLPVLYLLPLVVAAGWLLRPVLARRVGAPLGLRPLRGI